MIRLLALAAKATIIAIPISVIARTITTKEQS